MMRWGRAASISQPVNPPRAADRWVRSERVHSERVRSEQVRSERVHSKQRLPE